MSINVTCPSCNSTTPVSDEILGRKIRCRGCQEVFVAEAAKVKVGAGVESRGAAMSGPSRNGTNGVHKPAERKPAPANSGSGKLMALFGGGVALAITGAVMVWALFLRGDGDAAKTAKNNDNGIPANVAKIDLGDMPKVEAAAKPEVVSTNPEAKPQESRPKPETPVTTVSSPKAMMAGFAERPKIMPVMMERDVLERSKKSAVMIRTRVGRGGGEGSGWFAEPGIIVTNAHVVNMTDPAVAPPHSVRVILHSGTEKEKELNARILALDRENDLAVIRVDGKDLPEPLPISPSRELFEGQSLHIMGFPLGSMLAQAASSRDSEQNKAVTTLKVRDTTVAGRVSYTNGGVKYIQLEGGADHGNSGGAIVDNAGHVRSILVAGLPGTHLRFSIPSEYAVYLLQGRVLSITPSQPYKSGSSVKMPFVAQVADPLARIKKISLSIWAGDSGSRTRPLSEQRPSPLPGDGPVVETDLKYDAKTQIKLGDSIPATGEIDLPERGNGKVYWMRPKYERTDGSTRWGEAIAVDYAGQPVDKRGANLAIKHVSGAKRWVDINSKFGQGLVPEGNSVSIQSQKMQVSLEEQTKEVETDGARIKFDYMSLGLGDRDDQDFAKEQLKEIEKAATGMSIEMFVTNRGLVRRPKANLTNVPQGYRPILTFFNRQIMQSLETLALGLPEKDVAADETWNFDVPYEFRLGRDKTENVTYKLQFKMLGVRNRNGRDEAVVSFIGRIVKGTGNAATAGESGAAGTGIDQIDEAKERERGVFGFARGSALVDLETGYTTLATSYSDLVVDFTIKVKVRNEETGAIEERDFAVTFGAAAESSLNRRFKADAPKGKPEVELPEQVISLNPFVGAPDPSEIAANAAGSGNDSGDKPGATGTSPYQMPKDILDRVKRQGCLIRAKTTEGLADGSGWLAEPGIVVTNAHVVGMMDRSARPPLALDVYFYAGTPEVRKYSGKVLCVDYDEDLSIVQLDSKEGLPEPFTVVPSTDLMESQRLFVIGFPHGSFLGSSEFTDGLDPLTVQIKVRNTYVSGRVENKKTDLLKYIQCEGGVIQGNSGGAIVDMNGAVRCMCQSGMPDIDQPDVMSQLAFCVPSEFPLRLLNGHPLEVKPLYAYKDGSVAKQPVEIKFADPLNRVKNVRLDYWVGKPGKPRRSAKVQPKPRDDDYPRQTVSCTYDSETKKAICEFVLPETEPGYAYWIQPRYIDGTGNEVWAEATFYAPDGPPVERREIALNANFKKNSARLVDVMSDSEFRHVYFGQNFAESNHLFVTLGEFVLGPDNINKGHHRVGYKFDDMQFGNPRTWSELIKTLITLNVAGGNLADVVRNVESQALFTKDGVMTDKVQADLSKVRPIILIPLLKQFNDQVLQSVQTMSIRLPNKSVQYGEEWEQPTNLVIAARSRLEPALFKMKMKYLGVRDRGGRLEAVVDIKGSIANDPNAKSLDVRQLTNDGKDAPKEEPKGKEAPKGKGKPKEAPKDAPKEKPKDAPKDKGESEPETFVTTMMQLPPSQATGKKKPLYGDVKGHAYVDVESGQVSYCKLFLDVDVEITHKDKQTGAEIPVRAGGTMVLEMKRRSSNK